MKDEKRDFEMQDDNVDETKVMPQAAEDPSGEGEASPLTVASVRAASDAKKRILDAVLRATKDGRVDVSGDEAIDIVFPVVDALYDAYEAEGTVPTREAFAERCKDEAVGEVVMSMTRDPFVRRPLSKKAVAAICAGCVAAVAIIGCGVAFALGSGGTPAVGPQTTVTSEVGSEAEVEETFTLSIGVVAEGWEEATSSPVIAHIVSEAEGIDYYHAFDANEDARLAVPAGGEYEVSIISPVNADGSIYRVPGSVTVTAVTEGDDASGDLPFKFERVPAEDVTAEELADIMGQVTEAIKKGDETLTGEAGASVADTVKENCTANPNADAETVEEEATQANEAAQEGSSAQTGNTGGSSTGGSSSSDSGSGSTDGSTNTGGSSSGGGTTSGGSGGSSSGSTSGGGSSSSQPSHTHNWVAITTTVHHDAVYQTVHHDAVTEVRSICNQCGADITGHTSQHFQDSLAQNNWDMSKSCQSYSTKSVVVQDAYDEQVLVSEAWDETVTTGYRCSTCGAMK